MRTIDYDARERSIQKNTMNSYAINAGGSRSRRLIEMKDVKSVAYMKKRLAVLTVENERMIDALQCIHDNAAFIDRIRLDDIACRALGKHCKGYCMID